jgi:hypothetical protein
MSDPGNSLAPSSNLTVDDFIASGRTVAAGHGWNWIAAGFALFKKQPEAWILILIVLGVCWALVGLVPFVGSFVNVLLAQIFMGGIMLGCRALDADEDLGINYVFAGFSRDQRELLVLGVLAAVALIAILIPMYLIIGTGGFLAMMHHDIVGLMALGLSLTLGVLVSLVLMIPLYMALWFAPALIVLHKMEAAAAVKASFGACLKNIVPFLLYGIVLSVLGVIAAIPLGLGFLVLIPVTIASIYTAYRDIFFTA